jgi:Ca2+-binding RTX toxin-like protein
MYRRARTVTRFRTLVVVVALVTTAWTMAIANAKPADPPVVGVWQGADLVNGEDHGVVTMALAVESGDRLIMFRHDTQWGFCGKTEGVAFSRVRWNDATQTIEGAGVSDLYCFDGRTRRLNIVGGAFYEYDALSDTIDSPAVGNDNLMSRLCEGEGWTQQGSAGDDTLVGTAGSDIIEGLAGDDVLLGKGGFDVLCGGAGADALSGGGGPDLLWGEGGFDVLKGGSGHDGLFGATGQDSIFGNSGRDLASGGGGVDSIVGGNGADWLFGGATADVSLEGGSGKDRIYGGSGGDTIKGQGGNDKMFGQSGDDSLRGGSGVKDVANGGSGTDFCVAETAKQCE